MTGRRGTLGALCAGVLLWALASPSMGAVIEVSGPAWGACPDGDPPVECAILEVPLDHADPASRSIRLSVRRMRAHDPAQRLGVLITIAGGPGQRGTDGVYPGANAATIEDRFDIVSWDPRGTSGETLIDCIPAWDPYRDLDRTPDDARERRALDARTAELAERCRERHGWLLPYVGTSDSARDLEALRRWLGEERISVLGSSYGSDLALTYATLYPRHVRAIVLDGYSDPNLAPWDQEVEQAGAFEASLERALTRCAVAADCLLARTGTPGHALDALLARLDARPLRVGADRWLTQSDAYEAIAGELLLGKEGEEALLTALAAADDGHGAPLLGLAEAVRQRYRASGLSMGVFAAVSCADTAAAWARLGPADLARLATRVYAAAPRLGPWLWSPPTDEELPPVGLCAMLPQIPSPVPGPVDADGAGPILVLTTTGDPATPASAAARAPEDLAQATVVSLEGEQHLAYHAAVGGPERAGADCILEVVTAYLQDPTAPIAVSHCPSP